MKPQNFRFVLIGALLTMLFFTMVGCQDNDAECLKYEYDSEGYYIVSGCTDIHADAIEIPAQYQDKPVKAVGDHAFRGCANLQKVTLPNSITKIGEAAFQGCSRLKSLAVPHGTISIGAHAFQDCTALTNISLPRSLESIGIGAFHNCTQLTIIRIQP